jgi:hypothetical protein
VVVAFYTRSCGVCKELLKEFQSMCDEAKAAQVSVGLHGLVDMLPNPCMLWCKGCKGCKGCKPALD